MFECTSVAIVVPDVNVLILLNNQVALVLRLEIRLELLEHFGGRAREEGAACMLIAGLVSCSGVGAH